MTTQTRRHSRVPRLYGKNKNGEPCSTSRKRRYGQACCPHAPPAKKVMPYGYATTATQHTLTIPSGPYRGKYHLMTCCQMCGDSMNAQAAADPASFATKYVVRKLSSGALVLKNPHTGRATQVVYPAGVNTRQPTKRHTRKSNRTKRRHR